MTDQARSHGLPGWLLRHPAMIIGLAAMLAFAAHRREVQDARTSNHKGSVPPRPRLEAETEKSETFADLRCRIGALVLAEARRERAARLHSQLTEETGNGRAAEAVELILRVRSRCIVETESTTQSALHRAGIEPNREPSCAMARVTNRSDFSFRAAPLGGALSKTGRPRP